MYLDLSFFFFNDTATTEIYTLSLHDALPILAAGLPSKRNPGPSRCAARPAEYSARAFGRERRTDHEDILASRDRDRKSTRLNSSHANISYAVFCLKKKKKYINII